MGTFIAKSEQNSGIGNLPFETNWGMYSSGNAGFNATENVSIAPVAAFEAAAGGSLLEDPRGMYSGADIGFSAAGTVSMAAAAAFEAADVPVPSIVNAGHAMTSALVATNILGQNTAAIAGTEAGYATGFHSDLLSQFTQAMAGFTTPEDALDTSSLRSQQNPAPAVTNLFAAAGPIPPA